MIKNIKTDQEKAKEGKKIVKNERNKAKKKAQDGKNGSRNGNDTKKIE